MINRYTLLRVSYENMGKFGCERELGDYSCTSPTGSELNMRS